MWGVLIEECWYQPSEIIPTDLAIALAVMGWSPVTMITLIPADRHLTTASGTVARGGSIMDMRPTNRRPVVGKFTMSASKLKPGGNFSVGRSRSAKPAKQQQKSTQTVFTVLKIEHAWLDFHPGVGFQVIWAPSYWIKPRLNEGQ